MRNRSARCPYANRRTQARVGTSSGPFHATCTHPSRKEGGFAIREEPSPASLPRPFRLLHRLRLGRPRMLPAELSGENSCGGRRFLLDDDGALML